MSRVRLAARDPGIGVHIITDIEQIKRLTRRGQKRTVIAELRRRGIRFEVAHDGWPVCYIPDTTDFPLTRPRLEGRKRG